MSIVSGLFLLLLSFAAGVAHAQPVSWDLHDARTVDGNFSDLPKQDQQGILHRLGGKSTDLVALRVDTPTGRLFLVQGVGDICGAANCEFWVLSSNYRILLEKVIQMFKLEPTRHYGLPDILTSMHGSATDSSWSRWRFDGRRYRRVMCADVDYEEADGKIADKPHVSSEPCTGG